MAGTDSNHRSARGVVTAAFLATLYGAAAWLARGSRHCAASRSRCIMVFGTFYNPNWILSHLTPLALCNLGEVVVVCDEPGAPLQNVRFECPPSWLKMLLTRAGAKFCWASWLALHRRPDLFMGYHLLPCGVIALVLGRLFGRPACYQMTGGPVEIMGGGWRDENWLSSALGAPSPLIERRAAAVVRRFDSIVVRGSSAAVFVRELGFKRDLDIITGSVEPPDLWRDFASRPIDVTFVGRLTELKRPDRFIEIVAAVAAGRRHVRAAMIGAGPDLDSLRAEVRRLGLERNVAFLGQRHDVEELLAKTKVFVLTSRSEGVSIAMLEAMAGGAVPVVANVGDLADCVQSGLNGYLIAPDDVAGFASAVARLLDDACVWRRHSLRARHAAAEHGRDAIAARWRMHLTSVIAGARAESQLTKASGPIR